MPPSPAAWQQLGRKLVQCRCEVVRWITCLQIQMFSPSVHDGPLPNPFLGRRRFVCFPFVLITGSPLGTSSDSAGGGLPARVESEPSAAAPTIPPLPASACADGPCVSSWASGPGLPLQKKETGLPGPRHAQTTWSPHARVLECKVRELNAMISQLLDPRSGELEVVGVRAPAVR
jgi:hypothetical protein